MKRAVLLASVILAALQHSADARIGESLEQAKQRYGNAVAMIGNPTVHFFQKGEFKVYAVIEQGVIACIVYTKKNAASFSAEEIIALMERNSPGEWKKVSISDSLPMCRESANGDVAVYRDERFSLVREPPQGLSDSMRRDYVPGLMIVYGRALEAAQKNPDRSPVILHLLRAKEIPAYLVQPKPKPRPDMKKRLDGL